MGEEALGAAGDPVAAGAGDFRHGDDQGLFFAEAREGVEDVFGGCGRAAAGVDAQDDAFDGFVFLEGADVRDE